MRYHPRELENVLFERLGQFPVVAVTGPRQSGKTTMVRKLLPDWKYVTLEDFDMRMSAVDDPRGFLREWGPGTIIDEFQRAPRLVSYLQAEVDREDRAGLYVLTGSQSYVLHEQLSQSLAGRVGLLVLFPFAGSELPGVQSNPPVWDHLYRGHFPRVAVGGIPPEVWYPSFITTYIERDVRQMLAVKDLLQFQLFVKLLAARVGQLVNLASLSRDCGISVPTVRQWLSVLEAGYLIKRLPPWFSNQRKQLVKTPKLYFVDTGLLAHLLGIHSPEELSRHTSRGQVFENGVVLETMKAAANLGYSPEVHFWRDTAGNEVDLLVSVRGRTLAIEAKSSETVNPSMLKGLTWFHAHAGVDAVPLLAYAGQHIQSLKIAKAIPWHMLGQELQDNWR